MKNDFSLYSAIILAAGQSQRFGAPKVLQVFNGLPFLSRIGFNLRKLAIEERILVLGFQAQELIPQLPAVPSFKLVINEKYEFGQLSSLQAGLKTVSPRQQGVVMCLIDQPQISFHVYQKLLIKALQNPDCFVVPSFQKRSGHPVFIPVNFFRTILEADARQTHLKAIMHRFPSKIVRVEVDESSILEDIDTRDDLRQLEQKYKNNL